MDRLQAITAFHALAHEARLGVFQALVQAGPEGLPAGALARQLGMAANAMSFHLTRLRNAGLVESRREGQHIHYMARFQHMEALIGFLTASCCRDSTQACGPACGGESVPEAVEEASS